MLKEILQKLNRKQKISIVITADVIACLLALWGSFIIRYEKIIYPKLEYFNVAIVSVSLFIFSLLLFGVYKEVFRYIRTNSIYLIFKSFLVYAFIFSFIVIFIRIDGVPRSIGIIHPVLSFIIITLIRILAAYILSESQIKIKKYNLLIYGAGNAGSNYVASIGNSNEFNIIGFVDDKKDLENQTLNGYRIFHSSKIDLAIKKYGITHILLAMPYLGLAERVSIINRIKKFSAKIVSLPSIDDLALGKLKINEVNEIDINELLGRVEVESNSDLLSKNIQNQNILVSGAGGSIGRELCFQIIKKNPLNLIILDHNELSIFNIYNELEQIKVEKSLNVRIKPILCSILDEKSLSEIFKNNTVHTVYHAAAYKHVDMVERNIISGVKNNVFGTLNLCDLSEKYKVKNFILVSSDKAVNSTNIMGASKRISEMILASRHNSNNTVFSMVRFGNVLNSSGSVITLFRDQISKGGPVTVRDKKVTRYFMTIEEAATLVIQAGAMAKGGDIFILEMGKPINILDLAVRMIELSGMKVRNENNLSGDIEIEITELKSGEKMHEELFLGKNITKTLHPKILKADESKIQLETINKNLKELEYNILNNNISGTKDVIYKIITQ